MRMLKNRIRRVERFLTSPQMLPFQLVVVSAPTVPEAGLDPALLRRPNTMIVNNFMPGVDDAEGIMAAET